MTLYRNNQGWFFFDRLRGRFFFGFDVFFIEQGRGAGAPRKSPSVLKSSSTSGQ
jgi:hypothetical protein